MKRGNWICLRRDFQVTQSYWSLQIPALEDIPILLGIEKSGKGKFELINNYMYMNTELVEAIDGVLRGPSLLNLAKEIEEGWKNHIDHYLESSKQIDDIEKFNEISMEEIFNLLSRWQEANIKLLRFHPPTYFIAEALTGVLCNFLSGIVEERVIPKLLSGFPEETKKYGVNLDIWEIANVIKQDKKMREAVLGKDETIALATLNNLKKFRGFIKKHGHLGEVDPYFPKWAETPEKILKMIVNYLIYETKDSNIIYSEKREERECLTEEITAKLGDNQKIEFIELLNTTQSLYKSYEYEQHSLVRKGISSLRKLLLNMGKRFVYVQKIYDVNDIFFLEYKEILRLRYKPRTGHFASVAEKRKKWFDNNKGISAPPVIDDKKAPEKVLAKDKEKTIKGLGASEGIASGPVKIIYSADELWSVEKGDIVVTPMIFSEYTPILYLAEGIITDEGGICCHAAIVAREIGIPAVVGTRNATKILKNGMKVTLDGAKGIIEFDN